MKKLYAVILMLGVLFALTGCRRADYKKAMELYASGSFVEAEGIFTSLEDFENSEQMALACRYGHAVDLMEASAYSEASEIFAELGNYEDSEENGRRCRYELGLAALEAKDFETAKAVFSGLGDYKDTSIHIKNMPGYMLAAYLEKNGQQTYHDSGNNYDVLLRVEDGNVFVLEYHIGSEGDGFEMRQDFVARIHIGESTAALTGNAYMGLMGGFLDDMGTATWNIGTYVQGDSVSWEHYEITGQKTDGSDLDAEATGLAAATAVPLERMTDGLDKLFDQIRANGGPAASLADMGFAAMG